MLTPESACVDALIDVAQAFRPASAMRDEQQHKQAPGFNPESACVDALIDVAQAFRPASAMRDE